MAETLLMSGEYTPFAFLTIGGGSPTRLSLTRWQVEFKKNKVCSKATWRFATSVNSVEQHRGAYFQDVPGVELAISFEPEKLLLSELMQCLAKQRNSPFSVQLRDHDSEIDWSFQECYLRELSFNVGRDTILSLSLNFYVRVDQDRISYNWSERNLQSDKSETTLPISNPIAYYAWQIQYNNEEILDITQFNFTFTQPLIPKFGCLGIAQDTAPGPDDVLFDLPEMNFSYTIVMHDAGSVDFSADAENTHLGDRTSYKSLDFYLRNGSSGNDTTPDRIFTLTGLSCSGTTPNFEGNYPEYTRNFDVHGILC